MFWLFGKRKSAQVDRDENGDEDWELRHQWQEKLRGVQELGHVNSASSRPQYRCFTCREYPERGNVWSLCGRCNAVAFCGEQCQRIAHKGSHRELCGTSVKLPEGSNASALDVQKVLNKWIREHTAVIGRFQGSALGFYLADRQLWLTESTQLVISLQLSTEALVGLSANDIVAVAASRVPLSPAFLSAYRHIKSESPSASEIADLQLAGCTVILAQGLHTLTVSSGMMDVDPNLDERPAFQPDWHDQLLKQLDPCSQRYTLSDLAGTSTGAKYITGPRSAVKAHAQAAKTHRKPGNRCILVLGILGWVLVGVSMMMTYACGVEMVEGRSVTVLQINQLLASQESTAKELRLRREFQRDFERLAGGVEGISDPANLFAAITVCSGQLDELTELREVEEVFADYLNLDSLAFVHKYPEIPTVMAELLEPDAMKMLEYLYRLNATS